MCGGAAAAVVVGVGVGRGGGGGGSGVLLARAGGWQFLCHARWVPRACQRRRFRARTPLAPPQNRPADGRVAAPPRRRRLRLAGRRPPQHPYGGFGSVRDARAGFHGAPQQRRGGGRAGVWGCKGWRGGGKDGMGGGRRWARAVASSNPRPSLVQRRRASKQASKNASRQAVKHMRATPPPPPPQAPGTYLGVVERLDYLQRLGVNAIELLPVRGGWGAWGDV